MKKIILLLILSMFIIGCAEKPSVEQGGFQEDNKNSITRFEAKKSSELEDNRMGAMYVGDVYSKGDYEWFANDIGNDLALKWIRISFDWFDYGEILDKQKYSKKEIGKYQHMMIDKMNENGVDVMYTLLYWDDSIPEQQDYSRFKNESEIERYLDYVKFILTNLRGKITYYEILNEPNLYEVGQQHVDLEDYINLVKRVVPLIREQDPDAKIVVGATASFREENTKEYLLGIASSDIIPLVDGISFHPLYGDSPIYNAEHYYGYPTLVQEIKDTASSYGFKGEYIAEEMVWRTSLNPSEYEPAEYSVKVAAKYYLRGITMNLGMDILTGYGGEKFEEMDTMIRMSTNLATVMSGARAADIPLEIESEAEKIVYYTFTLTDGDRLIAIWNDKAAVDDDLGVKANLTFDDLSGKEVISIDVLNGYTQQITTNGNRIGNLIIRDYPVILKIKN